MSYEAALPSVNGAKPVLTSMDILKQIATKHRVTIPLLVGQSRQQNLIKARREAVARMHLELGLSLSQIGRRMHRDHTTILHTIRVESLTNKPLRDAYGFRSQNRDAVSAECIRLRAEGMRKSEICRRLGVTKGKLDYALRYKSFPQAKHGGN